MRGTMPSRPFSQSVAPPAREETNGTNGKWTLLRGRWCVVVFMHYHSRWKMPAPRRAAEATTHYAQQQQNLHHRQYQHQHHRRHQMSQSDIIAALTRENAGLRAETAVLTQRLRASEAEKRELMKQLDVSPPPSPLPSLPPPPAQIC